MKAGDMREEEGEGAGVRNKIKKRAEQRDDEKQ